MTDMPISAIKIGDRRREDMGDIDGLAESIDRHGLFHAVVIDDLGNLVAGHRRLMAMQKLGWTMVPTRSLGELTDAEKREIELEENLRRKDLTAYELSKTTVDLADIAAEVLRDEDDFSFMVNEKSPKGLGRPTKSDAQERVAERIAVSQPSISRAQQHVETADSYPFMQSADWSQSAVLEARKSLARMDEPSRDVVNAMVSQPGVTTATAQTMIKNVAEMDTDQRAEVVSLYQSEDPRDKSLAETKAANVPPDPDPRYVKLGILAREIRGCAASVPTDDFTPLIQVLAIDADSIRERIQTAYKERVNGTAVSQA